MKEREGGKEIEAAWDVRAGMAPSEYPILSNPLFFCQRDWGSEKGRNLAKSHKRNY